MQRNVALRPWLFGLLAASAAAWAAGQFALAATPQHDTRGEFLVVPGEIGRSGGRLVVSLRAEPKTLNPIFATDAPSREVISVMQADLVHINRSEEHTSELQSPYDLVCRLLLEKKKINDH